MKSRSLLLYVPGIPLRLESLLPQRPLASLASSLLHGGHETQIVDYGRLAAMERFFAPNQKAEGVDTHAASGWWPRIRMSWRENGIRQRFHDFYTQAATEVSEHSGLDFVVFLVNNREDLRSATQVALRLRQSQPQIRRLVTGRYIERCASLVLAASDAFDGALGENPERSMMLLAERIHLRERWAELPEIHFRSGECVISTGMDQPSSLEHLPLPRYDAFVYPALRDHGKIRIFSVENSRCALESPGDCSPWRVRIKPASCVCQEIAQIVQEFPASAFHLEGPETSALQMAHLASELRAWGLHVAYSREGHIRHADPGVLRDLAQSGCEAIDFQVDSGSQRLLEDFYQRRFSVSEIERVLRGSRAVNLFSTIRLTFPCPWDDYHTRAETVRILERCRPQGVDVSPPWLWPGSLWHQRAPEFGYRLDHGRYVRWMAATGRDSRGDEQMESRAPYQMYEWSAARIETERRALFSQIEALGIGWHTAAWEGLMARAAGYLGREDVYCASLRHALSEGDLAQAETLIGAFNSRVASYAEVDSFRLFTPLPAAVGN